jgi:acyl carrier protein
MKATAEEVMAIVKGVGIAADISGITANMSLRKAGIDSIEMFTIFLALEEKFGIKIPDADVDRLDTVTNIVSYLQSR